MTRPEPTTLDEALIEIRGLRETLDAVNALDVSAVADEYRRIDAENERMRRVFKEFVDAHAKDQPLTFGASCCEWCEELWPSTANKTRDETIAAAKEHLRTCTKHPLKAENARLRKALVAVCSAALSRFNEKAIRAILGAAKRNAEFTVEIGDDE